MNASLQFTCFWMIGYCILSRLKRGTAMDRFTAWVFRPVLDSINQLRNEIMGALSDAVARVNASTTAEIAAVIAKLSTLEDPTGEIAAAVESLTNTADTLDAETAALNADPVVVPTGE